MSPPGAATDAATAARFADAALGAIETAWPHKLDHLMLGPEDRPRPADIHPIFCGSYDWHSSVHMHWSLLRLLALAPGLPQGERIAAHFDGRFTEANAAAELRYASAPGRGSFERPYGWAWLLMLQAELDGQPLARRWADALRPLARHVAAATAAYFAAALQPVRAGTHGNTAFAMLLARRHAVSSGDDALRAAVDTHALRLFGSDRHYPAHYEPSGSDFLSAGLCEALLMREVLGRGFAAWWQAFMPLGDAALDAWLRPAAVGDRRDPQFVHLDGLNLSRAWCLASLAPSLHDAQARAFAGAASAHRDAAWPHVTEGDFVATHWLVSFALLALDPWHPTECRD